MKFRIFGVCALGLLASLATEAKANIVINGGFESPVVGSGPFVTVPLGSTAITGWTVISGVNNPGNGSVDLISAYFPAHSGNQSVDLDGSGAYPAGGLSQSLALTVGNSYTLDFFYSNNPSGASAGAQVTVAGLTANFTHSGATNALPNYSELTLQFVATSASQLLSFASTDPASDFSGIILDDVSVNLTVVPEPASTTLCGLGLISLACYARFRRRRAA